MRWVAKKTPPKTRKTLESNFFFLFVKHIRGELDCKVHVHCKKGAKDQDYYNKDYRVPTRVDQKVLSLKPHLSQNQPEYFYSSKHAYLV